MIPKKQLEKEIEESDKYDYAYFRSHGVDESLVQQCIDNIQKPMKELKATLTQTNEIIEMIEDKIDNVKFPQQVDMLKELLTKIKGDGLE